MSTLFYISGHGFGHASRELPVINRIGARRGERLLIRSAVSPDLIARGLRVPYELTAIECDSGVIQTTSVAHDDEATVDAAVEFYRTFAARVDAEVRALSGERVDLIVGDVPPLAFAVGAALGVPAVALANFTWDWIYETHPGFLPRGADALERIRWAYRQATHALELPFAAGFDVFDHVTPIPLVTRHPTRNRTDTRTYFDIPARSKTALISFGGYGMPTLDLGRVDCRSDWTVVTTDQTSPESGPVARHVRVVGARALATGQFGYEDLIAAVDVVITKPGYGIIAECITSNTPMLYTSRGHFREYEVLVSALPRFLRSRFISQADLFAGRWREALEGVLSQADPPERMDTNGDEVAVEILDGIRKS